MAKWEVLENSRGSLTFEITGEEWNHALDHSFEKAVKEVEIKGFRKGSVPRNIFEQKYGKEVLFSDAIDHALPAAYQKAVEEANIIPVAQPEINIEQLDENGVTIKATVAVKPEVKLGTYKGLQVEKMEINVTDEDIDQDLEAMREKHAELSLKDGVVDNGDTAVIDFEGFKDGVAFEGGKGENYPLVIGSGQFIPGFEEQLIGMKQGEEKDVNVSFPETYHVAELAGAPVVFKVKVNEIKERIVPEINEDFIKELNLENVATVEELRAHSKGNISTQREQQAENALVNQLVEKASETTEVAIPTEMVNAEIDRMLQQFTQQLQMQGMNLEMYYQMTGLEEDKLREQMKNDAEKNIRVSLTLEAIAETEAIEVSDEEARAELEQMAQMYGMEATQIEGMIGGLNAIKQDMKVRKAVDFIKENQG